MIESVDIRGKGRTLRPPRPATRDLKRSFLPPTFGLLFFIPTSHFHIYPHPQKQINLDTAPRRQDSSLSPLSFNTLSAVAREPAIMSDAQANEAEKNIEIWKVKKLIKRLEAARGNGTSMISLIIREL